MNFVDGRRSSLRRSVPKRPPPNEDEEPHDHPDCHQWASAQGRANGLCGTELDAVEVQKATECARTGPNPKSGNGISPETNFCGQPRKAEGLVNTTGRLRPIGSKGSGGQQASPGTKARQIYDDVIPRPSNFNVFSIDGETKVSEDFERKAHNGGRSSETVRGESSGSIRQ